MFDLVEMNDRPWVPADDLAGALEYARTTNLLDIFRKNRDEFDETDVLEVAGVIRASGSGGGHNAKTTYFSEEGAVLLCMFARTPVAKAVRRQIRDVFVAWRRGQQAALAPDKPEPSKQRFAAQRGLFDRTVTATVDYDRNTVTLELPLDQVHRLAALDLGGSPSATPTITSPAPTPAPNLAERGRDRLPDKPNLLYNFAVACSGMHGWYTVDEIAARVGCTKDTVHARNRQDRLPTGWTSTFHKGRVWVRIP